MKITGKDYMLNFFVICWCFLELEIVFKDFYGGKEFNILIFRGLLEFIYMIFINLFYVVKVLYFIILINSNCGLSGNLRSFLLVVYKFTLVVL